MVCKEGLLKDKNVYIVTVVHVCSGCCQYCTCPERNTADRHCTLLVLEVAIPRQLMMLLKCANMPFLLLHVVLLLQIVPEDYGYGDIYNMCALRLARQYNNSGPSPGDILYDLPNLWFDQEWLGPRCQAARRTIGNTR